MKYVLILLILAVVIAGCDGKEQQAQEQTMPDNNEVPVETVPSDVNSPPSQSDSDITNELTGLMEKQMSLNYHVDYETTALTTGIPEQTMQMSYYMQGTQRMRVDVLTDDIETRSYIIDNEYTTCTKIMGAWNCMDFSGESDEGEYDAETVDESTINEIYQSDVTRLPPKTIAGQISSCYRVEQEGTTMDYCYTADGIPTYVRTLSDYDGMTSESEMIATSISKTIPSGTFELPAQASSYEDMDIADIMNQYGMS